MSREEKKKELLSDPNKLLQKEPFYRGLDTSGCSIGLNRDSVNINATTKAQLPKVKKRIITQDEFMMELDPMCHKVLFDQNVPSITMKLSPEQGGGYATIEYKKMAVSFQRNIKDKQVQHLCGNKMLFTLMDTEPTEQQQKDYITYKQYWDLRNQDGMRTKMVDTQKSVGDAGLLYYFNEKGEIKSRLISYIDGYVLCPHNDDNGDRIIESVYYKSGDNEYIDSYDDRYIYRYINKSGSADGGSWEQFPPVEHGFSEIPLVTKRGKVAWDNAQSIIEAYEIQYNIFLVIQKRHGWGILYVKGRFNEGTSGKKISGAILLNDTSMDQNADAKFLTPPSPQGTIDTLSLMEDSIQKAASTTFILPKDVKTSGDISGIAIMLTQSMDIENALLGVIEWQNVADKMCRLFKEGLAKELVRKKIQPTAITDFSNININAKFSVWRPQSDTDLVNRLVTASSSGILSIESASELNPDSKPDEKARLRKEKLQKEEFFVKTKENTEENNSDNYSETLKNNS